MSYADLVESLAYKYKVPVSSVNKKNSKFHHALNGQSRGKQVVENYINLTGNDLFSKKAIDVGCGYGGVAVELRLAGADVIGLDLSERNLEMGRAYAKGLADVEFLNLAADIPEFREHIGESSADLICVTSVMEHIFRLDEFISNASFVLRPGGHVYFTLPNPLCFKSIDREVHTGVFGLSLISTDAWHLFWDGLGGTYYRSQSTYDALFCHFGFHEPKFADYPPLTGSEVSERLTVGMAALWNRFHAEEFRSVKAKERCRSALVTHEKMIAADRKIMTPYELQFKYIDPGQTGVYMRRQDD